MLRLNSQFQFNSFAWIKNVGWTLSCLLLAFISGCSTVNGSGKTLGLDTDLKIVFRTANDINPDERNHPSPVFIRLYELKSPLLFHQADFMTLYAKDKATLDADFVAKRELKRFIPGESREERFVLNPATKYVALYAEFFQYQNANYKVVFEVTPGNFVRNQVQLDLTGNHIVLSPKK